MTWSEGKVARILARNTFRDALCVLPNSMWTGDEIDLLVVPACLRVVDVEIKISRADLKADAKKERWWRRPPYQDVAPAPVVYPRHVWKHYFALPVDVWKHELLEFVQPISGVLVVHDSRGRHGLNGHMYGSVECVKRATPNRFAEQLDAAALREIARLASLRMWDAYRDLDRARDDHARQIAMYATKAAS
jgi:hypothetical protein